MNRANCVRYMLASSLPTSLFFSFLLLAVYGTIPRSILFSSSNTIPVTFWIGGSLPRYVVATVTECFLANTLQLPCWYFLFLGLTMQLNFHRVGGEALYLYWPVILIGVSTLLLFNPIRIFYYRSRMWLLYSLVCASTRGFSLLISLLIRA